eukprot:686063-Rhodomonas_salina.3
MNGNMDVNLKTSGDIDVHMNGYTDVSINQDMTVDIVRALCDLLGEHVRVEAQLCHLAWYKYTQRSVLLPLCLPVRTAGTILKVSAGADIQTRQNSVQTHSI